MKANSALQSIQNQIITESFHSKPHVNLAARDAAKIWKVKTIQNKIKDNGKTSYKIFKSKTNFAQSVTKNIGQKIVKATWSITNLLSL